MATATAASKTRTDRSLTSAWATTHVSGPFEIYRLANHEREWVDTLSEARDKATTGPTLGYVQVLAADRSVIGYARNGVWHGAGA